jgi:STE24 endopeptidase
MHFVLVMAVLAALVISENSPSQPVSSVTIRLVAALGGMGLVALFAAVSSGLIAWRLRSQQQRRAELLRWFKNLRRIHSVLWLAVAGGILYWLGWSQLVRFNWSLDRFVLVDDLLILAPVLVPIVLSWCAFYEVERALQLSACGEVALPTPLCSRRQYLGLHLRHYLGVLLLPVLGMLAFQDLARYFVPDVLKGPYAGAVYVPPLVLVFMAFPSLLRRTWETAPLEAGALRDRLEEASARFGFHPREILVWRTGDMIVNAAVAGFLPGLRYVFLSDALLRQLDDEEVEAVFGHEVGHVRHRHLLLRVAAMLVPVCLWLLIQSACPDAARRLEELLVRDALGSQASVGLAMLCGLGLYVLVVFGAYSRILETQADLYGCRSTGLLAEDRPRLAFISALEKLAAANGIDRKASSWQHASVAQRVDFLRQTALDPDCERRFHRRVRVLNLLIVAIVLSPAAYRILVG